jgi:thiamine pyrophosphate-dependent acetolactate synthase large subunit-like protein
MNLTGAQALVRLLAAERVSFAFGVVGGKLAPLLHAIRGEQSIRYIGVRHEAAGPMMAAAVFAGSGCMAVALGEMGPGGLNLASGVGTAFNNNLAVLLITTNQHRAAAYPHGGMFMDLDTVAVLRPLTKWNAVVHDPRRMPELVRRAFREALSGRPGPVHLDVPHDVLSAECTFADDEFDLPPERYRATARPRADAGQIAAAADLLRRARRPIIVAGGGVVTSGAERRLRELAQILQAPVLPTQMALGAVSTESPFYIGHGGIIGGDAVREAFEQSDTILAVGCRFSSWMWDQHGPLARRHHRLININLDPAVLGAPAPHEVALQADAELALGDLVAQLGDADALAVEPDWLPRLRRLRLDYERVLAGLAGEGSAVMHPAALARAVAAAIPRDAIAVYDGGHTSFWSNDFTPAYEVRTRFHDPGMSQLGFGLPYALSLQLQHPGRAVINITGDGAFGFTLQELDTARRHGLPVVNVIHNNAAWGIIQAGQRSQLGFELGTSLAGTDYAFIARGFGCLGETVTAPEDVAPAISRALASGLPSVIDCRTHFVAHPCLPAFGRMNQYGFQAPD